MAQEDHQENTSYEVIDEEDLLKNGNQPIDLGSNDGTEAKFSYVSKCAHPLLSKEGEAKFNELLKHPYTLPFCLTIMKLNKIDEVHCEDTVYQVLDMFYSPELEKKDDCDVLKITCRVRKGSKDETKTIVTGINYIKVFANDLCKNSIDFTVYDANNIPSAMIYFVVKATRYIVDYTEIFDRPPESDLNAKFYIFKILKASNADESYDDETKELARHIIKSLAIPNECSSYGEKREKEFRKHTKRTKSPSRSPQMSLLDLGMTPKSVLSLEHILQENSKKIRRRSKKRKRKRIEEDNILVRELPQRSEEVSLRYLNGMF